MRVVWLQLCGITPKAQTEFRVCPLCSENKQGSSIGTCSSGSGGHWWHFHSVGEGQRESQEVRGACPRCWLDAQISALCRCIRSPSGLARHCLTGTALARFSGDVCRSEKPEEESCPWLSLPPPQLISKQASRPQLINIGVCFNKVSAAMMYNYMLIIQCPRAL